MTNKLQLFLLVPQKLETSYQQFEEKKTTKKIARGKNIIYLSKKNLNKKAD